MTRQQVDRLRKGDTFIHDDYYVITDIYENCGNTYYEAELYEGEPDGCVLHSTGRIEKFLKGDLMRRGVEKC